MRLANTTIKKLIKGALVFETKKGYLSFFKYGKDQLEFFDRPDYDWGWRMWAHFSGGIRMEMMSDCTEISFDYKSSCQHERSNTIDLYINDVLSFSYHIGNILKGTVTFSGMKQEIKKVTIYFPCESRLDIKNFNIDGAYRQIKDKGEKVLFIGDSITQGAGPDISSVSYFNTVVREMGYNALCQGVGGYRYEPRDLMKIEEFDPDKIIIFLGTNYYEARDDYDYKKAVYDFYEKIEKIYPDKPKICITPTWRNNDVDWDRFSWCINTIKEACQKYYDVTVIDGFGLMPNVDDCLADGIHPNTFGSCMIAFNLIKILKDLNF